MKLIFLPIYLKFIGEFTDKIVARGANLVCSRLDLLMIFFESAATRHASIKYLHGLHLAALFSLISPSLESAPGTRATSFEFKKDVSGWRVLKNSRRAALLS